MSSVLYTSENRNTGTRHVLDREYGNPVCGVPACWQGSPTGSPMLGQFPEDFGLAPEDCANCAAKGLEQYVEDAD